MKLSHYAFMLLLGSVAVAQPPPDEPFPPDREPMHGGFGEPRQRMMIDRWLEKQKSDNPAEFARLKQLRESNPDAFREELRGRIEEHMSARLQHERPAIFDAIQNLPPEDREWLIGRIRHDMGPGGSGREPGPDFENRDPGKREGEEATRKLAQAYRAASDPAEKEKIKTQIRDALDKIFEKRIAQRRAELAKFEGRMAEMKQMLETREANRDAIIDRRLKELTEGENWAW